MEVTLTPLQKRVSFSLIKLFIFMSHYTPAAYNSSRQPLSNFHYMSPVIFDLRPLLLKTLPDVLFCFRIYYWQPPVCCKMCSIEREVGVFWVVGMRWKSEVSFRELTRVALLESCPSLLEYTTGRCRPPPLGERLRYVEAVFQLQRNGVEGHPV